MKKLAIIDREKCKPSVCSHECAKCCPVNKKELQCVTIENKAKIEENLCVGCGICTKKCPLRAIQIVNLPFPEDKEPIHRYGKNGFALFNLPMPKENSILGILGRNGIGKTSAIKILCGQEKPNFGKEKAEENDLKEFIKGSELIKHFQGLEKKTISYKPQNLAFLSVDLKVRDLLLQRAPKEKVDKISKEISLENILEKKLNKISGGELQKVAILMTFLKEADNYFLDEPLAYLDIEERLKMSDFIREKSNGKTTIIIEHDLLLLDYLTDYVNIFFGVQGAYGMVSGIKSTSYGINSYLDGFLKEENILIRDKKINFNFNKNSFSYGQKIAEWPSFKKSFGNFELEACGGEIRSSHVYGVLGKNGIGKTTFLKCLAGLEEINSANKINLNLKISYKPQHLFSNSEEEIFQVISKEKITKEICSLFNLESIFHRRIKDLSGGELQRFSIARCLAKEADIYFLDEPSAFLDVEERVNLAKVINDYIVEKGKTAFVIDHDLLLISYVADSILNFHGESGKKGKVESPRGFIEGISEMLKNLNITIRKDKESNRPKINKKDSVLDREQKEKEKYIVF
ncbi:MAG: ribosome biogenesis/translation initiation ATPase RLI [Candidatus Pacearchaeota archaeon]